MLEFNKEWKGDWYSALEMGELLFNKRLEDHTVLNPEITKNREYFFFKGEIEKSKKYFEDQEVKKDITVPPEDIFLLSLVMAKSQTKLVRKTSNSLKFMRE